MSKKLQKDCYSVQPDTGIATSSIQETQAKLQITVHGSLFVAFSTSHTGAHASRRVAAIYRYTTLSKSRTQKVDDTTYDL
jgi:hypothetical protein